MKSLFATIAAIATFGGAAIASPQHNHRSVPVHAKKTTLICPVTGDKIASVKAAVGHSTYKGKTYYFCCPGCKPKFDKNPAKYVKNAARGKFEKM